MHRFVLLTIALSFALSAAAQNPSVPELQKKLREAQASGKEPDVLVKCSYTDQVCDPAILYVSGSVVSQIEITDLPKTGAITVRITSGEMTRKLLSPAVTKTYKIAPDVLTIAIQRRQSNRFDKVINDALNVDKDDENPTIRYLTFGRAPAIRVQISLTDTTGAPAATDATGAAITTGTTRRMTTIAVPVRYQPWFVDMGGFMAFAAISDQELVTESIGNDKSKVSKKRDKDSMTPVTGAVLNLHPANLPVLALQFGLATNSNRQPSFFAGAGWRLREFGTRSLLTAAIGVAAVPALRFPDVKVGDERANSDAALKGITWYRYAPYVSLTFGFTFGDTMPTTKPAASAQPVAANIPTVPPSAN